jgi:hypothetical protein
MTDTIAQLRRWCQPTLFYAMAGLNLYLLQPPFNVWHLMNASAVLVCLTAAALQSAEIPT